MDLKDAFVPHHIARKLPLTFDAMRLRRDHEVHKVFRLAMPDERATVEKPIAEDRRSRDA